MKKIYRIELEENDLGQAIDGLEARAEAWENTASYLESGKAPHESFIAEECNGPDEANRIAKHYRKILKAIQKQMRQQHND